MRSALAVRDVPVLLALLGLGDLEDRAALGLERLDQREDGVLARIEHDLGAVLGRVVVVHGVLVEHLGEAAVVLLGGGGSTQADADEVDRVEPVLTDLLGAGGALGVAGVLGQVTLQLGPALGEVVLDALVVDADLAGRDERSVDVVHLGTVGGDGLVGVHGVLLGDVVVLGEHDLVVVHAAVLVLVDEADGADVVGITVELDVLVRRLDATALLLRLLDGDVVHVGVLSIRELIHVLLQAHVGVRVVRVVEAVREGDHGLGDLVLDLRVDLEGIGQILLVDVHVHLCAVLLRPEELDGTHGPVVALAADHADQWQVGAGVDETDVGDVHVVLLDVVDLDVELVGDAVRQVQSLALAEHAVVLGAQVDDVLRPGEASGDLHVRLGQGIQSVGHVPTDVGQAVVLTRDGLLVRAGADVLFHG